MCRTTVVIASVMALMLASAPVLHAQDAPRSASKSSSGSRARATASAPVNINSATAAQLQTLPGVGAGTAQRILEYRQKNGSFKKVEELMNVKGVGEKSFLKLKPLVVVSGDGQK